MAQPYRYFEEPFTPEEQKVLSRYFTNTDRPVFALVNLPEVVKAALFARYSRSSKSLRRLFLDEFYVAGDSAWLTDQGTAAADSGVNAEKAGRLFDRVFSEYGDDSVAQLGGVHLACEQVSNIFTKLLERGRLAAYLEQSTRYIYYDQKRGGRYQYFIPPEVSDAGLEREYGEQMDGLFALYGEVVRTTQEALTAKYPRPEEESERVWAAAIKAQACDLARPLLPGATLSNVGIYANGQALEQLVLRLQASPVAEARDYGQMMLEELRKVIPSFLRRVDVPDKGGATSHYLRSLDGALGAKAQPRRGNPAPSGPSVTLVEWDRDGELRAAAASLYPHDSRSMTELVEHVRSLPEEERAAILRAAIGDRTNRRQKPGRGFEVPYYLFEVVADYGAFRDLQRHRLLTIEWQDVGVDLGCYTPEEIVAAGFGERWAQAMRQAAAHHQALSERCGVKVAQYAVPFAYNIRFYWKLNARAAYHQIALRPGAGGHPSYRPVCQPMHRLIRDQAGHRVIADGMTFVDHEPSTLGRLEGERRAEKKRALAAAGSPNA
ncbi:MAG: FAD-dependent thymidylate synthase [Vicinamibacterales bacterium]